MRREQANSSLLPHRAADGVFVIRECSRGQGGYVLSFTTQGKVVHVKINRVRFFYSFSVLCELEFCVESPQTNVRPTDKGDKRGLRVS